MIKNMDGQPTQTDDGAILDKHRDQLQGYYDIRKAQVALLKARANTEPHLVMAMTNEGFAKILSDNGVPNEVALVIAAYGLDQAKLIAEQRISAAGKFNRARLPEGK